MTRAFQYLAPLFEMILKMKITVLLLFTFLLASYISFSQECPENDADCVGIYLTDTTAEMGELLCVDIFTCGFTNILSFQFSLSYREDLIAFNSCEMGVLDGYTCSDLQPEPDEPVIKTNWFQASVEPTTLDSAAVLGTICFDVLQNVDSEGEIISFSEDIELEIIAGDPDNLSGDLIERPGCVGGMPSIVMSSDMTSSVDEVFLQAITVGPNPFNDVITLGIDPQFQDDIILYVTDMAGKTIVTQPMRISALDIDLSVVTEGMYMLILESKNHGTYVQKIVRI